MPFRLLTIKEVMQRTGLSRGTLYALRNDPRSSFPGPLYLSKRRVAWLEDDISAWIDGLRDERDAQGKWNGDDSGQ